MTESFSFKNTYLLDKSHFTECYSETAMQDESLRPYTKAIVLIIFSLVLMITTEISAYMSYFIFGLGIVEALGVYYRKPWWIYRQLLSKAANNEVTLTIDEMGITTHSAFVQSAIKWTGISQLTKTQLGWVFMAENVKHYISDRSLNEETQSYLQAKQQLIKDGDA